MINQCILLDTFSYMWYEKRFMYDVSMYFKWRFIQYLFRQYCLVSSLASDNFALSIPVEFVKQIGFGICRVTVWIDTSSTHTLLQTTALQTIGTWLADTCEWDSQAGLFQRILLFQKTEHLLSIAFEIWICLRSSSPVGTERGLVWVVLLIWLTTSKDSRPALFVIIVSRGCTRNVIKKLYAQCIVNNIVNT